MDKALDSMLKQAVSGVKTIGRALNVETEAPACLEFPLQALVFAKHWPQFM